MNKPLRFEYDFKHVSLQYPLDEKDNLVWSFDEDVAEKVLSDFFKQCSGIIDVEFSVGMTDDICRIAFEYSTSDEQIEIICKKALEMIENYYKNHPELAY